MESNTIIQSSSKKDETTSSCDELEKKVQQLDIAEEPSVEDRIKGSLLGLAWVRVESKIVRHLTRCLREMCLDVQLKVGEMDRFEQPLVITRIFQMNILKQL